MSFFLGSLRRYSQISHSISQSRFGWNVPKPFPRLVNALTSFFQNQNIIATKLDISTALQLPTSQYTLILENAFTPSECKSLIQISELIGFSPALVKHSNSGKEVQNRFLRNNSRIILFDEYFAAQVKLRLNSFLPKMFNNSQLSCLNERIKIIRYCPGEKFAAHYDGIYTRPDDSERSLLTLQIYLNEDFEGGETIFINPDTNAKVSIAPKAGMVLAFQKDLLHEGAVLKRGNKYTIRTGVMFKNN